jgi:hypothetical protein
MPVQIQLRRGIAAEWTTANPVLAQGELAVETDTNKFKIGNGVANWNALPYGGIQGVTGIQGIQGSFGVQGTTGAGVQGTTGIQGFQGIQGPSGGGVQGIAGITPSLERHFNYPGILSTSIGTSRWWILGSGNITKISARVTVAPIGSNIVAYINKNGTTVHTATISANTYGSTSDVNLAISDGDYITVDIVSIGSSLAGSDLVISFLYVRV